MENLKPKRAGQQQSLPQQMQQQQQRETLQEDIDAIKTAFAAIDTATTACGTAATAVKARLDGQLAQIADLTTKVPSADTMQSIRDLVTKAQGETAPLTDLATSLNAMAQDPGNPVPTPAPVVPPAEQP